MNVKDKKRGRPAGKGAGLSRESIIIQAKSLMLENSKTPSIRQLASSLKVDAMAIYYYFSNKASLLEAITVSLIEDIYEPRGSADWQQELALLCKSYLALLSDHAGLMETLLSMTTIGPAQVFAKRFSLALTPLALNEQDMKDALDLLVDYLHGYALAMHCCSEPGQLTLEQLDGPLKFYMAALTSKVRG
ncbi:TetR/AcrR family transcriptional regulator [Thalassomonas actiniarum]|uniref:TetR family transcriptional regulator n=1 Tax=Thalassomonas actiniarum TaxID=485447 RepID=A0AAE9YW62_9GAMM|nr:TetR/AcrR family transcriptional regulator [Thalassomonas actiniarum]WDE02301.1 TetR family transcriptional regulator [Thalassomonas actiniarum]